MRRRTRLAGLFLAVFAALMAARGAQADELRPGYVELVQQDQSHWSLGWKNPVAAAGRAAALAVPEFPAQCRLLGEVSRSVAAQAVLGAARLECGPSLAGGRIGMPGLYGNADVLVRVAPLGRAVQTYRLTATEPAVILPETPGTAQVWRSYFLLGIDHILTGWDHLLFVVALVLLVVDGWRVVKAATAFTIAHSITLAGATLGLVGLPQQPVEALIALSIVFLAAEVANRGRRDIGLAERLPWLVAFLFGLLHGFGFAGALREIGLPEGEVPAALLSFNLGVEAGQVMVIAAVIAVRALIGWLRPAAVEPVVRLASYAIGITGTYWLIDRLVFA